MNKTAFCPICGILIDEKYHLQKYHQAKLRPNHSAKMKELYANGKMASWNKDATKETNKSVLKQSQSLKKYYETHEPNRSMQGKQHSKKTRRLMSLTRYGPKNSNWKGGVTALKRGDKRSPRYYQWRMSVLRRDNYICQKCGENNSRTAHHIRSYKSHPSLRYDIENGITLCKSCHKKIHFGGDNH